MTSDDTDLVKIGGDEGHHKLLFTKFYLRVHPIWMSWRKVFFRLRAELPKESDYHIHMIDVIR